MLPFSCPPPKKLIGYNLLKILQLQSEPKLGKEKTSHYYLRIDYVSIHSLGSFSAGLFDTQTAKSNSVKHRSVTMQLQRMHRVLTNSHYILEMHPLSTHFKNYSKVL